VTQQSARVEDGSGNIIVQAVDSTVSIGAPATLKLYPWHRSNCSGVRSQSRETG